MKRAVWIKRNRRPMAGAFKYCWSGGYFLVRLDSVDPVTGLTREFRVYNDDVSFNGWHLAEPESDPIV